MEVDLKNRPSWREIANASGPVVGAAEQIKSHYLKAIEFASRQSRSEPGKPTLIERAALTLAQGLKPVVALRLAEKTGAMLQEAAAYKNKKPNLDVVELCKQDALQRWRAEAPYMRAPKAASPQVSAFGQKLDAALAAQANAGRDIPAATSR